MRWPTRTRQLLVVTGLTGFAISQPLLSILGDAPTELAYYGIGGSSVVTLACLIAFVPPVLLWGTSQLAGLLGHRLDRWVHLLTIAALVALFAVQVVKALGLTTGFALLIVSLGAGAGFAVAYVRVAAVRTWASYTAALPLMAVAFFLLASPASALLDEEDAPERVEGTGEVPSVVLVILDDFPTRSILDADDGIDAARFPNLAAFADDATWYRHHSSLATLTEAAVPTMLTGTLPVAEEAVWTNHPDNLFTLLAPTHELEVIEQATELCPYDVCVPTAARGGRDASDLESLDLGGPGFGDLLGVTRDLWVDRVSLREAEAEGFDDFAETVTTDTTVDTSTTTTVDETSPSVTARPGPEDRPTPEEGQALTSARAQAFISSFDASKGPALYYLHLMIPHQPFNRYPDGQEYDVIDPLGVDLPVEDNDVLFSWSPWVSAVSEQQHLLQAEYGDRLVGQVVAGLREAGLYDESLVIFASDHGISFEDRTAARYVDPSSVDAIAYSPLLVKAPGQTEGAVDDTNVMAVDLLPTIAHLLDLEITWTVDGAPIGSEAIGARGAAEQIYDMVGFGGLRVREVLDFDDTHEFGTVGDRFIGALPDPDDPLSALHARLRIDDLIGRSLDDLTTGDDPRSVALEGLDQLERPGSPALGLVTGDVSDAPSGARLLLAIDGVVVGGSELSTDSDGRRGRISVLLSPGLLADANEVRAALVHDEDNEDVRELDVRAK